MKRILTIQDISCVGKCSLTVALPIISAMGVETSVIPTAVLSTHTAFQNFIFRDLTGDIKSIFSHWKQEGISFDAVYTGYLGSLEQIRIVSESFDEFKTASNIIFVDPVMGDNGRLYTGFSQEFAFRMVGLCGKADIIVPNLTEACFMLGIPYIGEEYNESDIKEILKRLCGLGAEKAVLTGVSFCEQEVGVMAYDSLTGEFFTHFSDKLPASFHGTGDIFASCCIGGLMNGLNLEDSLRIAVAYTTESIKRTIADPDHRWYGVNFEAAFPFLLRLLEQSAKQV